MDFSKTLNNVEFEQQNKCKICGEELNDNVLGDNVCKECRCIRQ